MSGVGPKIVKGLQEAVAGNLHTVIIKGQKWKRANDLLADQQAIMKINNDLRECLLNIRALINQVVK